MANTGTNITIYDIARESGFSPKTVSRVLNNEKNVSSETAQKIKEICDRFNYTPNRYARNLKAKKDKTFLLSIRISPGFPSAWIQRLIENIGIQSLEQEITIITEYFYKEEDLKNSIMNSSKGILDGVVLFYEHPNDIRIKRLTSLGIPFIIFEKSITSKTKYVGNDNFGALYNIFNSMCKKGLTNALLLLGKETQVNIERVRGCEQAFFENDIQREKLKIIYEIISSSEAYNYIKSTVTKSNVPQLIFISGDERAPGVYKALRELDIRIPEDVSILGFDNIPLGVHFDPAITTLSPNYKGLATQILHALSTLSKEEEYISTSITTTLTLRESLHSRFLM